VRGGERSPPYGRELDEQHVGSMPLQCIGDVILVPTARDCDLHADRFGDLALEARVVAEILVADENLHEVSGDSGLATLSGQRDSCKLDTP
jgi:hypothetical protein